MGVSKMQGTPWHIEYLRPSDDNREEKKPKKKSPKDKEAARLAAIKSQASKYGQHLKKEVLKCPIKTGQAVISKQYGEGRVTNVDGTKLTISFESFEKLFSYPDCLKSINFKKGEE